MGGASAIAGSGAGPRSVCLESFDHRHKSRGHRAGDRRPRRDHHLDTGLANHRRRRWSERERCMATLDSSRLQADEVFAVPPLPRRPTAKREIDFDAAEKVAAHIEAGGISHLLYGGNAFLYHASLGEFDDLAGWLAGMSTSRIPIPSIGPSFG